MPRARYEILDVIASGDYATVHRGRDHELSRDVAIKQIHAQYLADPRQLDRYWQEAQLLASLQHPHIMTIYDLVRERGWLILELMQGSLTQLLAGRPIDLKDLRLTLNYTLQALQAMHRAGILHGDVKPSNLLVDRNQRVKLGDFGIARRIAGEGSVVKGTTRYIAPEVVSDQFGPVGPHSDLYSLGFTAYELMCGQHFESLFPGLNMYGRDKQMAWMMWHSALDRRLPEISRVLEGVPADLAHIIQKLTEKDPAKRYRTTDEVLADLKLDGHTPPPGPSPAEQADAEAQERTRQRRRSLAIAAAACSVVLSFGMLFLVPSGNPPAPVSKKEPQAASGILVEIDRERGRIFVQPPQGDPQAVLVRPSLDRVLLNGQLVALDQLELQDQLQIATSTRDGQEFLMIEASRGVAEEFHGSIVSVDPAAGILVARPDEPASGERRFSVGEHVSVEVNGQIRRNNQLLRLADLQANDRVFVRFNLATTDGADPPAVASVVKATRQLAAQGFVVEAKPEQLVVRLAESWNAANAKDEAWPVAADCLVAVNGRTHEGDRALTIADLQPQDRVAIEFDSAIHRVTAQRIENIHGVVESFDSRTGSLQVVDAAGNRAAWKLADSTKIVIAGTTLTGDPSDLRPGDPVVMLPASADAESRELAQIAVTPQPDVRNWVILLAQAEYNNARLPTIPFLAEDAVALHAVLRYRYRVPGNQCLWERNGTRLQWEREIPAFLNRVPGDATILVFCLGYGFIESAGTGYFAPQGFDERRASETGIAIRWLIESLEKCAAGERLLVLDTSHDVGQPQPAGFAAAAELATSARPNPRYPISESVAVLASCGSEQLGFKLTEQKRGAFGSVLTSAFAGQADADRDYRVTAKELAGFAAAELAQLRGSAKPPQVPQVFWPEPPPARLSADARAALKLLDAYFERPPSDLSAAAQAHATARQLCEGQPDADLLYALLLLRRDQSVEAEKVLKSVLASVPDCSLAHELLAWLIFRRGELKTGVGHLESLIRSLPTVEVDETRTRYARYVARVAGRMAGFGRFVARDPKLTNDDLAGLAAALNGYPDAIKVPFREGYRELEQAPRNLEQRIDNAADPAEKSRLQQQRTSFPFHVPLDVDALRQHLR